MFPCSLLFFVVFLFGLFGFHLALWLRQGLTMCPRQLGIHYVEQVRLKLALILLPVSQVLGL